MPLFLLTWISFSAHFKDYFILFFPDTSCLPLLEKVLIQGKTHKLCNFVFFCFFWRAASIVVSILNPNLGTDLKPSLPLMMAAFSGVFYGCF